MPFYLRGAVHLLRQGVQNVSSRELGSLVGANSWQVRKDFSYFGGNFGTPGVGYEINHLIEHINRVLKLNTAHKAALVGVGNLGVALLTFPGFSTYGFQISAAFDIDKRKIGKTKGGIAIEDVSRLPTLKNRGIALAIIAVPAGPAQDIADELVDTGVRGILNFSPCYISVPKKVKIITIDIAMDLACLPYYMPSGQASR
jgi:redox-sensing transcriptional repressor